MNGATRQSPAPDRPVPRQGRLRVRVRYCECDPMGVAHHASYVAWLEMGRTELLRESGVAYRDLEAEGVLLVVTRLEIRYRRPARYDDEVTVVTRVVGGGRARIDHEYEIRLIGAGESAGELLATASSTLACVDPNGRPRALPDWLTARAHLIK
ncbi:MAG: acyl-CoA thioesterase [Planctomycetota bacterium]|nr:MAG: acyl-CoA thioesterase [Planctomycetota bacterium]